MAIIIDGKMIAKKTRENLKKEVEELKKEGITPKLAVIMVGDNPASKVYVKNKSKACDEVGVEYEEYILEAGIKQKELLEYIKETFGRQAATDGKTATGLNAWLKKLNVKFNWQTTDNSDWATLIITGFEPFKC